MSELCINSRRAGDLAAATTTRLKRQSRQPVLPKMSAIDPNMAATCQRITENLHNRAKLRPPEQSRSSSAF
jgi:hypothetical protein